VRRGNDTRSADCGQCAEQTPCALLDRRTLNDRIIAANTCRGEGMFVCALRKRFARAGVVVGFEEHDLIEELASEATAKSDPQ